MNWKSHYPEVFLPSFGSGVGSFINLFLYLTLREFNGTEVYVTNNPPTMVTVFITFYDSLLLQFRGNIQHFFAPRFVGIVLIFPPEIVRFKECGGGDIFMEYFNVVLLIAASASQQAIIVRLFFTTRRGVLVFLRFFFYRNY